MANGCVVEGCEERVHARDMCSMHYQRAYRDRVKGRPVRWADVKLKRSKASAAFDAVARLAELRLAVEAAHARVTQALLALEHPDHRFGATPNALLRDALEELDNTRKARP